MHTFWCKISLKKNSLFCLKSSLLDLWFLRGLQAKSWKHWSYAVPERPRFRFVTESKRFSLDWSRAGAARRPGSSPGLSKNVDYLIDNLSVVMLS